MNYWLEFSRYLVSNELFYLFSVAVFEWNKLNVLDFIQSKQVLFITSS